MRLPISDTYLDDRNDIGGRVWKFAHVHREMLQLVLLGLFQDNLRPITYGMDAPKISGRIRLRVGCSWDGDVWYCRLGEAVLPLGLNRAIPLRAALVFYRLNSDRGFGLLAAKQAHIGGDCRSKPAAKAMRGEGG
jgi:hypothetical protein